MANELTSLERETLLAELRRVFEEAEAEALVKALEVVVAHTRDGWVTREDFASLREIITEMAAAQRDLAAAQARTDATVRELVAAQLRTEERVGRLEEVVERLAEAQVRTEERVGRLEEAATRLADAQARTEERVGRLEEVVQRLVEAQVRTEERLGHLADAQVRTEERLDRLAEAQARSEERLGHLAEAQARSEERLGRLEGVVDQLAMAVRELTEGIDRLRKQVGGLSETVGGDIEDIAYIVLHDVLKREFGWQVGVLGRSWEKWNEEPEEVNVFGEATDPTRPGQKIWIVGEAKHNLTLNEVERFARQVERARQHLVGEVFPVCFCYRARPEVQERIRQIGLRLVFSYGKLV